MNTWYPVWREINEVESRGDGPMALGRSTDWGHDGHRAKVNLGEVKNEGVREGILGRINVMENSISLYTWVQVSKDTGKWGWVYSNTSALWTVWVQQRVLGVEGKTGYFHIFAFYFSSDLGADTSSHHVLSILIRLWLLFFLFYEKFLLEYGKEERKG